MEKRKQIRMTKPGRDKINSETQRKQKALTIVGASCFYSISHIIRMLDTERKQMSQMNTDQKMLHGLSRKMKSEIPTGIIKKYPF